MSLTNPDSALRHGAWVPTAPAAPDLSPGAGGDHARRGRPVHFVGARGATHHGEPSGREHNRRPLHPGIRVHGERVATATQAPLRLTGVNTILDRFTIQFSGRPKATPIVLYSSTEKPVREPSTGRWFFPEGVVQGSGVVEGGFRAEVSGGTSQGFRAD